MTTREYLNQIKKIDLMIEAKLDELSNLRMMACNITIPAGLEKVKSSPDPDKLVNAVAKIIKTENEIDKLVEELISKRKIIIGQIDSIEEVSYYSFLTYKYIQNMSSKEISSKMGIEHAALYRVQKAALQEFEDLYGEEYM